MLHEPTSADFTPYLHQTFQLQRSADLPVTVELLSVQKTSADAQPGVFAVVLRGSACAYLPHSQYTLAHPQLGMLPLRLVPIGVDQAGIRYEATLH
jgi:hypothetical protein